MIMIPDMQILSTQYGAPNINHWGIVILQSIILYIYIYIYIYVCVCVCDKIHIGNDKGKKHLDERKGVSLILGDNVAPKGIWLTKQYSLEEFKKHPSCCHWCNLQCYFFIEGA